MDDQRLALYAAALDFAERQVAATAAKYPDYFPIYTEAGRWFHRGELWTDWTGGFYAGMMWRFYRRTGSPRWRDLAIHYSRLLEHRQHDRNVHDLGFVFLNTYLPWFADTKEDRLRQVLIQAGRTLAMRFMERGQYLRSFLAPTSLFIDIMMNVPLIFYAARETHDKDLERIALAHCRTTRDTIVRPDGSTAHEGIFDLESGRFVRQSTQQGLAAESVWSRGLAWSLYGFSTVYGYTGLDEFLEVSERNAEFWLANLPPDRVSWWDFRADLSKPLPWGPQKDSSATAIAAAGLWQLAGQTKSSEKALAYRTTALAMLDELATPRYLASESPGCEGILLHGVYHTAKGLGVDESVMWGDYFFVEALSRVLEASRRH